MYSLNSLRMPSMSSAVLSSANVHDLQALAGGSPWWANTVHHVITSPSHRTRVLVWMLIEWQMPTLLLYTASCTRRMRVTAFFTSRVIALDFFAVGGGLASPTMLNLYLLVLGFLGAALAALLLGLRLGQAITDGYTLACSNQTGQIAVEGVGGECCLTLGDVLRLRAGENYAQNLANGYRIIAKRLVKIIKTF